jgi:hypothetical protein
LAGNFGRQPWLGRQLWPSIYQVSSNSETKFFSILPFPTGQLSLVANDLQMARVANGMSCQWGE